MTTKYPNYFIYDVFKLGSRATHAIDVELRDRQCNRQMFTILLESDDYLIRELDGVSNWYIKGWGDPYPCDSQML